MHDSNLASSIPLRIDGSKGKSWNLIKLLATAFGTPVEQGHSFQDTPPVLKHQFHPIFVYIYFEIYSEEGIIIAD
jgi:hypothetical protein